MYNDIYIYLFIYLFISNLALPYLTFSCLTVVYVVFFVNLFVQICPFIYLSIYPSICLSSYLSFDLPTYLPTVSNLSYSLPFLSSLALRRLFLFHPISFPLPVSSCAFPWHNFSYINLASPQLILGDLIVLTGLHGVLMHRL